MNTFCRSDADFRGVQVCVDVSVDVNRDVRDVTTRFMPSYSTIFTLFDAITRGRQRDGVHLDRRKQDIQAGHRVENKTFGSHFHRLEPKQQKQKSGFISNKAEQQKVKLTGAEQFCSERNGKHESDLNRRNAESAEKSQKAQKGDMDRLTASILLWVESTGRAARRRLDSYNRSAPVRAASGRSAPCIYQYGIKCRFYAVSASF